MPGGDGTGPFGMGPMSGRAAGLCAGYAVPGYMNRGFWGWGRGGGWGRGRGWRWRNWFYATGLPGWQHMAYGYPAFGGAPYAAPVAGPYTPTMSREQEVEMLRGQAQYFEDALEEIKKRIEELESKTREK